MSRRRFTALRSFRRKPADNANMASEIEPGAARAGQREYVGDQTGRKHRVDKAQRPIAYRKAIDARPRAKIIGKMVGLGKIAPNAVA